MAIDTNTGFNVTFSPDEIRETCIALSTRASKSSGPIRNIVYSALLKFEQWRVYVQDRADEETKDWIRWKMFLYKPTTNSHLEEEFQSSQVMEEPDLIEFAQFICARDYSGWILLHVVRV